MAKPLFLGIFENEEDVVRATRATRERGYEIYDVYAPYAVHGLDEAMGLRPSRLTWVCLVLAGGGFLIATLAQFWIGAIDWPLNVGGRPFNSLPAYLPVMFETTVLIGGVGVTLAMLIRARLYPGKPARLVHEEVTNNRFVLAMVQEDSSFDQIGLKTLWESCNAVEIRELAEGIR
ncbi:MAG: DUF3341 domain-containing protein [Acidobacteriota bacterium]